MLKQIIAAQCGAVILLLCAAGSALAAPAATITITETNRAGTASGGPFFIPNVSYTESFTVGQVDGNPDSFTCDATINPCYEVQVEVNLPSDYAAQNPTDRVRVTLGWLPQVSDLDMHVYKPPYATAAGSPFRKSRNNPPTPEVVEFPALSGNNSYRVFVVPAAPAVVTATVTVSLLTGPPSTGTPTVRLGGPTFANYTPPTSIASRNSADEPTMGVNLKNNNAYMLFRLNVLEAAFNDAVSPATATWRDAGTGGAPTTADPFMTMDQHRLPDGTVNERIWIAQLLGGSSYIAYTDNAGGAYTRSLTGPGQVHGVDNQSIAVGPYPNNTKPVTARPGATYPHAMYYCSHLGVNATCSRSDDGGQTFNPSRPIFELLDGCNNHGHVKVGADGTVYVPMNNSCQGHEGVSLSTDAGETWHYIQVPGTVSGRWDSSIAVANDGKTIWYGYGEQGDDHPMIIKGTLDKSVAGSPTIVWEEPAIDVGAPAGLQNMVFSTVVAGDPGRAAFAFHGTTTAGDSGTKSAFPATAEWHLYVATTFDGGRTWELRNATPGDPTQKGSICDKGTTCSNTPDDRNLLDFMDMDIDGEGRIVVGYADGCVDACVTGGANTLASRGYLARQVTGKRMYAAFDPVEGNTPGAAALSATRNALGVDLAWAAPAPGAAPIDEYLLERATDGVSFRRVATLTGSATKYSDTTAIRGAAVTYTYRITASNSFGAGAASNLVAPLLPAEDLCTYPGLTVLTDKSGDNVGVLIVGGEPLGPPAPDTADLLKLTVTQPYLVDGNLYLTFLLKNRGRATPLLPDSVWFISFTSPANDVTLTDDVFAVRMITDAAGVPRFESYKVAPAQSGARRGDFVEGTPKPATGSATADGLITITVPAADVRVTQAGQSITGLLALSSKLAGANVPDTEVTNPGFVGFSQPLDLMPDSGVGTGSVKVVQPAVCGPNTAPLASFTATPQSGNLPLHVTFDASGSSDPDATASDPNLRDTLVNYVFDFGDGSAPVSSASPEVTHTYTEAGTFGVALDVQDSRGKVSENIATRQMEISDVDTIPDAFGFPTRTGVATGNWIASLPVKIGGFGGPTPITASGGGQYNINGAPFTNQPGTLNPGDSVRLRHRTSADANTAVESGVTIGGVSGTYRTVTGSADRTPDAIEFYTVIKVPPGTPIESNIVMLLGFNVTAPILPRFGIEYRVDGGEWNVNPGSVLPGQTLQVRHLSSTQALGVKRSVINVGGTAAVFVTRTR